MIVSKLPHATTIRWLSYGESVNNIVQNLSMMVVDLDNELEFYEKNNDKKAEIRGARQRCTCRTVFVCSVARLAVLGDGS